MHFLHRFPIWYEGETPLETVTTETEHAGKTVEDVIKPLHEAVLANTDAVASLATIIGELPSKLQREPAAAVTELPKETAEAITPAVVETAKVPEEIVTVPKTTPERARRDPVRRHKRG